VAFNGIDLAIVIAAVAVGCVLTYVSLQRAFRRTVSELRLESERKLDALTRALNALQTQFAKLSQPIAIKPVAAPVPAPVAKAEAAASTAKTATPQTEEVTPELLVVMAAAVTAFLGKKVRIRSAKMLQSPYEIVNPWSQQGRVFVQASHNLRSR
jgi:methylmalonyl-CoA carboxyltransferase large subunit